MRLSHCEAFINVGITVFVLSISNTKSIILEDWKFCVNNRGATGNQATRYTVDMATIMSITRIVKKRVEKGYIEPLKTCLLAGRKIVFYGSGIEFFYGSCID